ncbi:MAG: hypothetical protein ACYCVH_02660 [Ignavibacteriaceae bacterium]
MLFRNSVSREKERTEKIIIVKDGGTNTVETILANFCEKDFSKIVILMPVIS